MQPHEDNLYFFLQCQDQGSLRIQTFNTSGAPLVKPGVCKNFGHAEVKEFVTGQGEGCNYLCYPSPKETSGIYGSMLY